MNLKESKINNLYNIEKCEQFLSLPKNTLKKYLIELEKDKLFLDEITKQILFTRKKFKFKRAIFRNKKIDNIHEFSFFRVLLYVLVRHFKPKKILETGIFYGGNSVFLLKALHKNKQGILTAIDLPHSMMLKKYKKKMSNFRHPLVGDTEKYREDLLPGFIIPKKYKSRFVMCLGEATKEIKKMNNKFDFYIHDSDHSYNYLSGEMSAAYRKLKKDSIILVDDIDWSNAFYNFVTTKKYHPLLFTDNGKDNLRVRTGLVYTKHKNNNKKGFTN